MKRIYLMIVLMIGLFHLGKSQNIPLSNQYLVNKFYLSPSFAGVSEGVDIFAGYRDQWKSFPGSPLTKTINVNTPAFGKKVGLGVNIISDNTDIYNHFFAAVSYAYHLQVASDQYIDFSLSGTAIQNNIDFAKISIEDPNDPVLDNARLYKNMSFNAGASIVYRYSGFHIGVTAPYLARNRSWYSTDKNLSDYTIHRMFVFHTSWEIKFNQDWSVEPFFVGRKVEFNPFGYDIAALVKYKNMVWAGGTYRDNKDIGITAGFRLSDAITLSYTYEFGSNKISSHSMGTHDLTLGFNIGKELKKTREKMEQMQNALNQAQQNFQNQLNEQKKSTEGFNQKVDTLYKKLYEMEKQINDLKSQLANAQNLPTEGQQPNGQPVRIPGVENEAPNTFYIVVETFSKKDNALNAKKTWSDKGLKPIIVYSKTKNKFYIVASKYKTKGEADKAKKKLRDKGTDCWIYSLKKK